MSYLIFAIHPFQLSSWNDWNVRETRQTDQMEEFHIVLTLI